MLFLHNLHMYTTGVGLMGHVHREVPGLRAQTLNRSPIYSRPCQDWGVDPNHHSFTNGTFIYLHDFHWFPCVFVCMAQHIDIVTRYCVYVQMFTKRVAQKQAISVYSAYLFPLHRCRYSCTMFYDNIVLC